MNRPARPVIFVDDDPDLRAATAQTLELAGYQPTLFPSAAAALAGIDAGFPGCIVTDIRMPGEMDGVRLAQWVHEQMPRIPVIIASAYAQNADEAKAAGEEVFVKPYRMEDVVARIRAAIDRHKDLPAQ